MELNRQNYYSHKTDLIYQSPTFFKKFLACEAETMAEIKGEWKPIPKAKGKDPLIQGNYLHSWFESPKAHEGFLKEEHDNIFKTKTTMYADFKKCDKMIDTLASDSKFNQLYQGDKEVIVTGQIGGVDWKGKIDCLNLDRGYFIDLKTTQDIHKKYWSVENHEWQPFIYSWNYQLQMYVYQELIHQQYGVWCEPYIVAVSKQDTPDKAIISIPDEKLSEAQLLIEQQQEHIEQVRHGEIEPVRCEECEYCRSTKKLNEIISADDLIN